MSTSRKPSAAAKKTTASPKSGTAPKTAVQAIGLDEIKALIALVGREPFQEFEFEAGDMRFRIRKDGPAQVFHAPLPVALGAPSSAPVMHIPAAAPSQPAAPVDEPGIHYVTSPIVGTF
jgi:biotin carboxyl carrier protein